jgi:hypothetical protein
MSHDSLGMSIEACIIFRLRNQDIHRSSISSSLYNLSILFYYHWARVYVLGEANWGETHCRDVSKSNGKQNFLPGISFTVIML